MQTPQLNSTGSTTRHHRWLRGTMLFAIAILSGVLFAPWSRADDDDPPDRVARISFVRGEVSVQLADANEWVPARLNRPLTNNDQLWTDNGARAELQIGGSAVQVDENTQLSVLELSDKVLQLQLTQGVVNVYVRGMERDDTIEIDTPNAAAAIQEPGTYRVQANDAGDLTVVQVRDGSAEVSGEQQTFAVRDHEQVTLRGSTRLAAQFDEVGRLDDFDRWANARNQRGRHVAAARYVSSDVIGYEDLDDYGNWSDEPDYGQVWIPTRVVAGWAPYRYGHWEWIPPWGWTWVDDAPWGFAPFHYGRWAFVRERWCWVPGPRTVRAVYAPALVAWVGSPGVSVSVSVGTAPVGWVPLGPREIYRPTYRVSYNYVQRVNVTNTIVRVDEFERRYREPPARPVSFVNHSALTVVPANALRSAQPVPRAIVRTDPRELHPIENAPPVKPDRAALVGGMRAVAPPARVITREVVARREPAPIVRAPSVPDVTRTPRSNIRVVEPLSPQRPSFNQPSNEPRRIMRPQRDDAAAPDRERPMPGFNATPRNNDRVIETDRDDRGPRRGFTPPIRSVAPEQPNNIERPAPLPERRDIAPSNDGNIRSMPRDTSPPEWRSRPAPPARDAAPRERDVPRPVMPVPQPRIQPPTQAPREERPASPPPQLRPQPESQPQRTQPQNREDSSSERPRRIERDTR